jgi:hypothetical protein
MAPAADSQVRPDAQRRCATISRFMGPGLLREQMGFEVSKGPLSRRIAAHFYRDREIVGAEIEAIALREEKHWINFFTSACLRLFTDSELARVNVGPGETIDFQTFELVRQRLKTPGDPALRLVLALYAREAERAIAPKLPE